MKIYNLKTLTIAILFGSLLCSVSCKNYLDIDNPATLSQDAIFKSVAYTNSAVVAVYNQLPGDDGYGSRISILYPQGGEDFKIGGDFNPLDRRGLSGYGASPDNTELNNPFIQLYRGIERANICIKFIPQSDLYNSGSPSEQATMRKLYGEVLTLRAQFYHELIRNWGDVPAQFVPASDIPDLYLPKEDRDVIYDKLLEDLELASTLVPWRSESGEEATRITKAAVKGLRARIALARGGYSLRRQPQAMIRRDDYKTYYQIALDECKAIIDKGENGLNPSYENLFKSLHGITRNDPTHELIFEVGAFGGNARTDTKLGYSNGIRMNTNSSYGLANGGNAAIPTYFYEFDQFGDSRRDVTLAYFEVVDANDNKGIVTPIDMREGKFRKYWTNIRGTNQTLGINYPIIRYADILLMYAEADNEINQGPSALAKTALELVRKRAFVGFESRMPPMPNDYLGFFNAIYKERLLEFGGEGMRKYDLIRWNLLETTIIQTRNNLRDFSNGVGKYANVPLHVYFRPTRLINTTVTAEIAGLDLFGGPVNTVMFNPSDAVTPTGYTRRNWRAAVTEDNITGPLRGFAVQFEPNKKELFPIFSGILNQNRNLTQDYGY